MNTGEALRSLQRIDKEIMLLEQSTALLEWDEETQAPQQAADNRSEQISLLKGLIYDRQSSDAMRDALETLRADSKKLSLEQNAVVRIYRRTYEKAVKTPKELVVALSEAASRGQQAWTRSRVDADFSAFAPYLERIIDLKRQYAEAVGYEGHPYDALLDDYEPGMRTSIVDAVFTPMKESITELLSYIQSCEQVDDAFLYRKYPKDLQDRFGRSVLDDMGFDFTRGRLDLAVHPFTTTLGFDDIRITTRYDEPAVSSPLYSTIHEGGHALYELGASNEKTTGTVLAQGVSMAVHESQSRLWENVIGRSEEFWEHYFPLFQSMFPEQTASIDQRTFVHAINKVEPSMIRVNADEVTYSLHIILRYELEKRLIEGSLEVRDLPAAWNAGMQELLGITPADDAQGILQDVHWSAGLIGYFPTYALGNVYGAQFYEEMKKQIPELDEKIASGELRTAGKWLREQIYQHGSTYLPLELLERVTGKGLDSSAYIRYLNEKYRTLYQKKEVLS